VLLCPIHEFGNAKKWLLRSVVFPLILSICFASFSSTYCLAQATDSTKTNAQIIDALVDMDNTLVRGLEPGEEVPANALLPNGDHNGHSYRVLDGAPELLQWLIQQPNVRVSIFSGGDRRRNEEVLSAFKLPNGETALESIYRLLSAEDGTNVQGTLYKDLKKINPDLNQIFIIEDHKDSPLDGQKENVLWIGSKFRIFPTSLSKYIQNGANPDKKSATQFVQYRNRLAYAAGIVKRLLKDSTNPDFSVRKSLSVFQWTTDAEGNPVFKESIAPDLQVQREGAAELHRINPGYHYTSALPEKTPISCICGQLRSAAENSAK
jgi:hypothetical protein